MYGVLYAYTPEVFPAPHRGTGDALASAFNRVTGILAPVIKIVTTPASGGGSTSTANGCVDSLDSFSNTVRGFPGPIHPPVLSYPRSG